MNLSGEENQRKNAESIVENAIKETSEIFLEYLSYFGIEERIRNVLFAEIYPVQRYFFIGFGRLNSTFFYF